MMPIATKEAGQAMMTAPDVCYIPAPPPPPLGPGGIPTPFPNMGMLASADKTSKNVLVRNKPALVEGSEIPSSKLLAARRWRIRWPGGRAALINSS